MIRRTALVVWPACLAVLVCGCVDKEFRHDSPKPLASAVTDRAHWHVQGDLPDLAYAIDDKQTTAAVTGGDYTGAAITIDLGKVCLFNMVVIDHGPQEHGFCHRVAILTSSNGTAFVQRCLAPGTRRVTIASLITPTLARYVRIQAVAPGSKPWSVGEVYIQ